MYIISQSVCPLQAFKTYSSKCFSSGFVLTDSKSFIKLVPCVLTEEEAQNGNGQAPETNDGREEEVGRPDQMS